MRVLIFAVLVFALVSFGQAQDILTLNVAWDDPNGPDDQVQGYNLYESTDGATFIKVATVSVGTLTGSTPITLKTGLHWYAVTAFNAVLESDKSDPVKVQTNNPKKLTITSVGAH